MMQATDIDDIIKQRQAALADANSKKGLFFERATNKFKPLVENLSKYKMQFIKVKLCHNGDFGVFSHDKQSYLVVTPKGVGVIDMTKDNKDNSKFVEVSLDSYNKLPLESQQGDLINLVSYLAQNIDYVIDQETEGIYNFYSSQLNSAKENALGWEQLADSII